MRFLVLEATFVLPFLVLYRLWDEKEGRRSYSQYALHNSARVLSLAPIETRQIVRFSVANRNTPNSSVFSTDAHTGRQHTARWRSYCRLAVFKPLRIAVPFWGYPIQILCSLSPKRDRSPKRVKNSERTMERFFCTIEYEYTQQ